MTRTQSASPQANASNGKGTAPTHIVYQVLDREGDKSAIWTRIGAAWPHNDGKGFNITLPADGRLSVRVASEAKKLPSRLYRPSGASFAIGVGGFKTLPYGNLYFRVSI